MRTGKIARLPLAVREELNQRLLEGEPGNRLVEWLNAREDVQGVLKEHFNGAPINEPNLSQWTQGGYEDWRRQQEATDAADRLWEETTAVAQTMARREAKARPASAEPTAGRQDGGSGSVASRGLVDRAADMAALMVGEELMAIRRMEAGAERRRLLFKLVRAVVRLRKAERDHERGLREAAVCERGAEFHRDCRAGVLAHAGGGKWRMVEGGAPRSIAEMSDKEIAEALVQLRPEVYGEAPPPPRLPPSPSLRRTRRRAGGEEGASNVEVIPKQNSSLPPEGGTTNGNAGGSRPN